MGAHRHIHRCAVLALSVDWLPRRSMWHHALLMISFAAPGGWCGTARAERGALRMCLLRLPQDPSGIRGAVSDCARIAAHLRPLSPDRMPLLVCLAFALLYTSFLRAELTYNTSFGGSPAGGAGRAVCVAVAWAWSRRRSYFFPILYTQVPTALHTSEVTPRASAMGYRRPPTLRGAY